MLKGARLLEVPNSDHPPCLHPCRWCGRVVGESDGPGVVKRWPGRHFVKELSSRHVHDRAEEDR